MTPEQARELEQRLKARGLSRKDVREAMTEFRAWLAAEPTAVTGGDDAGISVDPAVVEAIAAALLRDIRRS